MLAAASDVDAAVAESTSGPSVSTAFTTAGTIGTAAATPAAATAIVPLLRKSRRFISDMGLSFLGMPLGEQRGGPNADDVASSRGLMRTTSRVFASAREGAS